MTSHAYGKTEWRSRNVEFLLRSRLCWGGRLPCRYVELLGRTGDGSFRLMREAGLLGEGDDHLFVGVDMDRREVRHHRAADAPFQTVIGNAVQVCNELRMRGEPPGALNLDLESAAGDPGWWRRNGRYMASIANAGVKEHGSFCLILNASLDGGCRSSGLRAPEVLRRHAKMVTEHLGHLGVTEARLLPPGTEAALSEHRWMGKIGSFDVYRSPGRRSRMATLRTELPLAP